MEKWPAASSSPYSSFLLFPPGIVQDLYPVSEGNSFFNFNIDLGQYQISLLIMLRIIHAFRHKSSFTCVVMVGFTAALALPAI